MTPQEPLRWSTRIATPGVRGGVPVWAGFAVAVTFIAIALADRVVPIPAWVVIGVLLGVSALTAYIDAKRGRRP